MPGKAVISYKWPRQHQKYLEHCRQPGTDQHETRQAVSAKAFIHAAELDLSKCPYERCTDDQDASPQTIWIDNTCGTTGSGSQ